MVNRGGYGGKADLFFERGRLKHNVNYTPEDVAYFETLKLGVAEIDADGRTVFKTGEDGETFPVTKIGPLEVFLEDNLENNDEKRAGVIGRIARESGCNAYAVGYTGFVNVVDYTLGIGCRADATPFRVYQIGDLVCKP